MTPLLPFEAVSLVLLASLVGAILFSQRNVRRTDETARKIERETAPV